jgi:hypothetical protein
MDMRHFYSFLYPGSERADEVGVVIQIPIVWFTPWTAWDLRLVYVVVAILDNALIYGSIYLVEKAMTKRDSLGNPS